MGLIILSVSCIIAYHFLSTPSSPTGLPKPLAVQSGKFADGEMVELIEVRRGNVIRTAASGSNVVHADSSVSTRYPFWPLVQIVKKTDTIRNQLVEYQVVFETPDPLTLEFRWSGGGGELVRPRKVSTGFDLLGFPDRCDSTDIFKGFPTSSEMIAASSPLSDVPDIIVQIPDGKGGWVSGSGPVWVEGDPHASCFVVFPAWIRSEREMKVRFVRCGNLPLEFTVPNPDVRSVKPFVVPSNSNPSKFSHPEFDIELKGVTQWHSEEQFPSLEPEFLFQKAHGYEMCWQWGTKSVEDESGNNISSAFIRYPLPDVGAQVRFHGLAEPTEWHPREISECMPVCEGSIGADGSIIPRTPIGSNAARVVSVKSAALSGSDTETVLRFSAPRDIGIPEIPQAPGNATVPQIGFSIELKGECPAVDFSALEGRLGKLGDWRIVVFRNGETRTCNATFLREWGPSTSPGGQSTYHVKANCVARCNIGDTVRICLARKIDPVPVSLTFPKSQIRQRDH